MKGRVLLFLFAIGAWAQTTVPRPTDPYAGAIKKGIYSNAFFGFTCEMPHGVGVSVGTAEQRKSAGFLVTGWKKMYGLDGPVFLTSEDPKTHKTNLTLALSKAGGFLVVADQRGDSPSRADTAAVADSWKHLEHAPDRTLERSTAVYGGREFQAVRSYKKTKKGNKDLAALFVIESKGYRLRFVITAEDEQHFSEMLRIMETLRFDPTPSP
jgi:hypothetical protein